LLRRAGFIALGSEEVGFIYDVIEREVTSQFFLSLVTYETNTFGDSQVPSPPPQRIQTNAPGVNRQNKPLVKVEDMFLVSNLPGNL